ncbi:MAG: 2OG-Fe(II) oxygenase [Gammaproteobacteria bacterium]|nr:MAG: 2OG-Fe(II) oxygenase [Gammaproteobacteria bacterium]
MNYFDDSRLDVIADALAHRGYLILDESLPHSLLHGLLNYFNELQDHQFKAAGIGRHADFQQEETIRLDKIHWINANTEPTSDFLQWMESLRIGINRRLFMGLFDYESHFAHYTTGAFYKKHLDAFRSNKVAGQANRVLSTVLYLNESWQRDNGGELIIYAPDSDQILEKILPEFGRMVIFLSEKFPHEVLPASCERKSVAGWFRVNEGAI